MIVHDPNGNIWGIDFRETAPMKSSKEDWAEKVEFGEYRHFTYMPYTIYGNKGTPYLHYGYGINVVL